MWMRRPAHLEHFIVDRIQSLLLDTGLHLGTAAPIWQEVGLDIGIGVPLSAPCRQIAGPAHIHLQVIPHVRDPQQDLSADVTASSPAPCRAVRTVRAPKTHSTANGTGTSMKLHLLEEGRRCLGGGGAVTEVRGYLPQRRGGCG